MAPSLRELLASTPLSGGNAPYVEALYEQFLADPRVGRARLARLLPAASGRSEAARRRRRASRSTPPSQAGIVQRAGKPRWRRRRRSLSADAAAKQGAVSRLVQIYANRGHLVAKLDPLGLQQRDRARACWSSATSG